jgi:uncharacterized membrane protein
VILLCEKRFAQPVFLLMALFLPDLIDDITQYIGHDERYYRVRQNEGNELVEANAAF